LQIDPQNARSGLPCKYNACIPFEKKYTKVRKIRRKKKKKKEKERKRKERKRKRGKEEEKTG
jgi:hypothetical protein